MSAGACEACDHPQLLLVVENEPGPPFRVCRFCARRLESLSLRPVEWFRLAARHGWTSHLLRDDFYDDDGVASQPRAAVLDADRFPYPPPATWGASLELALDVAFTKWSIPSELLPVFAKSPTATLAALESALARRTAPLFEETAYEICASALGSHAAEWVRARWNPPSPATIFSLARASAACLPSPEGVTRVIDFIRCAPAELREESAGALAWFDGEQAVDLLEELVHAPVSGAWGRTAAACSVTWDRLARWLEQGRPLSLVALDALMAFADYDTLLLRIRKPYLRNPPTPAELRDTLERYAMRDSVPRVRNAVAFLVPVVDKLCGEAARRPL